ncbi:MAG: hypothetical protein MK116_07845 [Phycisphaerales bacterium]|nr:hypothetical protein [Phycisphaerales bacterium]
MAHDAPPAAASTTGLPIDVLHRFLLLTAAASVLVATLAGVSLIWGSSRDIAQVQLVGTGASVLFGSALGLLATRLARATIKNSVTQVVYALTLALLFCATAIACKTIWVGNESAMPLKVFLTTAILVPAALVLLKLTGLFQPDSRSQS